MSPTQAALLTCKECNTVRLIQPHARGNTKLKQQKKVDPEHYVRPFAFVTNNYYFNRCDRLCKHQHGRHFQHSVTTALTYTCVLISTSSPPYSDCLISYMLPTIHVFLHMFHKSPFSHLLATMRKQCYSR